MSLISQSVLNEPIYESQIEEKLKKKIESEFKLSFQKLEEQAKKGIEQREEAIKKLKKIKEKLSLDLDMAKK